MKILNLLIGLFKSGLQIKKNYFKLSEKFTEKQKYSSYKPR